MSDALKFFAKFGLSIFFSLAVKSALAVAPCLSITNFAQLVQAGTCYVGPNNSVTLGNFQTDAPASVWAQIGATTNLAMWGNTAVTKPTTGSYGLHFDTSKLKTNEVTISFNAQCDGSCNFNDGSARIEGNAGSGAFTFNGVPYPVVNGGSGASPIFKPYVKFVSISGTYKQTAVPNMAAASYEMAVNILPSDQPSWPTSGQCPSQ
jgi:hypothetical protein